MERMYKLFGRITRQGLIRFAIKRLPFYVLGLTILTLWGVRGLMITFLLVLSFALGWIFCKLKAALADYRLTQRLNRIHFTAVEFDSMKRERDMALQAWQELSRERSRGAKAAPMPPTPPGPPRYQPTVDQAEIEAMIQRHLYDGEGVAR